MIFKYGTFSHADEEVAATLATRVVYTPRGFPDREIKTMTVSGTLIDSTQAGMTTKIQNLQSAYSNQGQDARLLDDSSNATPLQLIDGNTLSGVRVVSVEFPEGERPYSNRNPYRIVLEGDFEPIDGTESLFDFREQVEMIGTGGPMKVLVPLVTGPPDEQVVQNVTIVRATQRGSSVGRGFYPNWPAPLYPSNELVHLRNRSRLSPTRNGLQFTRFTTRWSYVFEFSSAPVFINPGAI